MDYSPTPIKVKPQYEFLDNSIEIGRANTPFKGSPLKYQSEKDTENLKERRRQFYDKYELNNSPEKRKNTSHTDTGPRLFKSIGNKIPVEDDVKINSNMIGKIIRENENLKSQLKQQKKDNQIINDFADKLRNKLVKYKTLNEEMKNEIDLLKKKQSEKVDTIISDNTPPQTPDYRFDSNEAKDIFANVSTRGNSEGNDNSGSTHNNEMFKTEIETKIVTLEKEISKVNNEQHGNFEFIKKEIEFLKKLVLQIATEPKEIELAKELDTKESVLVKEDDLIVKESQELLELQKQVDIFTKKLELREQNKKNKYKLNQNLEKLKTKLEQEEIPVNPEDSDQFISNSHSHEDNHHSTLRGTNHSECKVCDSRARETAESSSPIFSKPDTTWY